jgi:hypothetical protein
MPNLECLKPKDDENLSEEASDIEVSDEDDSVANNSWSSLVSQVEAEADDESPDPDDVEVLVPRIPRNGENELRCTQSWTTKKYWHYSTADEFGADLKQILAFVNRENNTLKDMMERLQVILEDFKEYADNVQKKLSDFEKRLDGMGQKPSGAENSE